MIFGGNKFLRRIISLVLSAAMVISMSAVLSSCGGKRRITVWVYSEEYRKEAQRRAMEVYGWTTADFIREFGKNHL